MKRRNFILSCLGAVPVLGAMWKKPQWKRFWRFDGCGWVRVKFEDLRVGDIARCDDSSPFRVTRGDVTVDIKSLPRWKPTITLLVLLSLCGVASAQGL